MSEKKVITGLVMDKNVSISYVEVCQKYNLSEELLTEMMEHGLFETKNLKKTQFDYLTLNKIQSAQRLQHDLGINMPGVVLVLELLEELERVRQELGILQRQIDEI
ncbi:chaperone modulator CbpM [Legionella nagasakiensis]|uniref:chaperone modulator CbpM n=1 Tax=Legionella nagasakiensis TaxID=535290 RepID=UPI0010542E0C|nr:chaperone modulator CbpM [Legionella nagasakiensis]